MDPRNQNKIRAVTNLRFNSNTLQTSESLAEESGIGLTKKERQQYIEQHKNAYYYQTDPWKYAFNEDEENTPSRTNYELKPMSLAQASPMQDHYNSSQYKSAYTGMIFGAGEDYDTMFA